ncbi:MAG: endonuclease/exonuclease/phosphatase family protein [Myxococcales bacterium]|nr:endonuclease/exonuclease/phosphatase family protein [Myxococcales bacterium]
MKLRVLSYNIHKCIGGVDRRYEPSRIVEVIRKLDADVVMLQEVDAGVKRSGTRSPGRAARRRARPPLSHMVPQRGRAWWRPVRQRDPLALSADRELEHRSHAPVSEAPQRAPRRAARAPRRADRTVHVFNMHLGLARYERKRQLEMFLGSHPFAHLHHDTPVVVGGDFNDVYGGLGELLAPSGFRGIARRPLTFPAWGPLRALDAIFVRGAMELQGLSRCDSDLARRASDHRPLLAEVKLQPPAPTGEAEPKPPSPRP